MPNTTSIIRNVTLNYAKVHKSQVNPYGKDIFDIQLEFEKDRIAEMSEFGKVRELPNGNFAINLSRPAKNNKGQKNSIRVVDAEKKNIKADIGNGSTGNVMAYSYDWEFAGNTGRKTVLIAVQVTDLVAYTPTEDFDVLASEGDAAGEAVQDF
jgi:hypothetical protein